MEVSPRVGQRGPIVGSHRLEQFRNDARVDKGIVDRQHDQHIGDHELDARGRGGEGTRSGGRLPCPDDRSERRVARADHYHPAGVAKGIQSPVEEGATADAQRGLVGAAQSPGRSAGQDDRVEFHRETLPTGAAVPGRLS